MKKIIIALTCLFCVFYGAQLFSDVNKGAKTIVLKGGYKGDIQFPHQDHQQKLNDCNLCHDMFGQQKGSITDLKSKGKLDNKTIMNQVCIKCHRSTKQSGKPSGPTTCSGCHQK